MTAEEILISEFKKRIPGLENLDGFVYKKAILEAMNTHARQMAVEFVFECFATGSKEWIGDAYDTFTASTDRKEEQK